MQATIELINSLKIASFCNFGEKSTRPYSKLNKIILTYFYKKGFLKYFFITSQRNKTSITYSIRRNNSGNGFFHSIKVLSKPSHKFFFNLSSSSFHIKKFDKFSERVVVSTSAGVITLQERKLLKLGGILLFIFLS